jgi:integrase
MTFVPTSSTCSTNVVLPGAPSTRPSLPCASSRITLPRPWTIDQIPYGKKPRRLPAVLSRDEVVQLFAAVRGPVDRLLLQTAYAAGLRLSEVIRLRVSDIDSRRMLVWVRQGKGGKDRCVPLSPRLLTLLRDYWQQYRVPLSEMLGALSTERGRGILRGWAK